MTTSIQTGQLDAALAYLAHGLSIVPLHHVESDGLCSCGKPLCGSQGKHTRINWEELQQRRPTEQEVRQWWQKWPSANIGVITGQISNLVVLDVDGEEGMQSLEGKQIPPTPTVRTGSGGLHYWFAHPGDAIRNFAHRLPGLDLRADGGLVVAPPSNHVQGVYEWLISDIPREALPEWILGLARKAAPPKIQTEESPADQRIQEGQRNDTLFRSGCAMRGRGMSPRAIEAALLAENQERCRPPLPDTEVRIIAASAARYVPEPDTSNSQEWLPLDDVPAAEFPDVSDHRTDWSNAQRLVAQHGADIRFCPPDKTWFIWDGIKWTEDTSLEVHRRAKLTVRALYEELKTVKDRETAEALYKHAIKSESTKALANMVQNASSEPGMQVTPAQFDSDDWKLNCSSGLVDLRTGKLEPHKRDEYCSKLAPVEYDPKAECPLWLAFLDRIFDGNAELISYLQRAVGYSLTGDTREEVFFLLYGTGRNGKGVFIETLRRMLGGYAKQTDFKTFVAKEKNDNGPREDIAELVGSRFVSASEVESGKELASVVIKQLTGRDTVSARALWKSRFEFIPKFKIFLAANHKPVIRETTTAMWERVHLIPFTQTIPEAERDLHLKDKLRDRELPGILRWAVDGCLAWQEDGLKPPDIVRAEVESYRSEMDFLAPFLEERCITGVYYHVAASSLYSAYKAWSIEYGHKPASQVTFGMRLMERSASGRASYEKRRSGKTGTYTWHGIGLLADYPGTQPLYETETDVFDSEE